MVSFKKCSAWPVYRPYCRTKRLLIIQFRISLPDFYLDTPTVVAFWATFQGFGLLCYILLADSCRFGKESEGSTCLTAGHGFVVPW